MIDQGSVSVIHDGRTMVEGRQIVVSSYSFFFVRLTSIWVMTTAIVSRQDGRATTSISRHYAKDWILFGSPVLVQAETLLP